MAILVPTNLIWLTAYLIIAVVIGYFVGARHSRKQQKEMLKDFNKQSLAMLDVKSNHSKLSKLLGQSERKDRVLKLTLKQLKEAKQHAALMERKLKHAEKSHYIKTSRLRLLTSHSTQKAKAATNRAVKATAKAKQATAIAVKATNYVKQLEKQLPQRQASKRTASTPYSHAAAAKVRPIERPRANHSMDSIAQVSSRNSAKLSQLRPSNNSGYRFNSSNLQAIDGISPSVEKKLNQAGIHRVEQLATMSDSDLAALSIFVTGKNHSPDSYSSDWKGDAQRLLRR